MAKAITRAIESVVNVFIIYLLNIPYGKVSLRPTVAYTNSRLPDTRIYTSQLRFTFQSI